MMNAEEDIKTMKLYNNFERLKNELQNAGYNDDGGSQIELQKIIHLLFLNYTGIEGCERAIAALKLTSDSHLLDIGCGVGGPVLCIADRLHCRCTAVDLQQDVIDNLTYVSSRCGLNAFVDAVRCDVRDLAVDSATFDGAMSILTILHIPIEERASIFAKIFDSLKPGACLYIEDYFARGSFTNNELASLQKDVYCSGAPSAEEYAAMLTAAGFVDVQLDDRTAQWGQFTAQRCEAFAAGKQRFETLHNAETFASLLHFYRAVQKLFSGGHLGGACIVAKKPNE